MEQTSGGAGEGQHDCCQPPADWLRQLSATLVTHTALPEAAAAALEEVFVKMGVTELRLVLANGDSEALECFALVEESHVNRRPLVCGCALDTRSSSAAYESMRRCAVVEVTQQSPERHSYADWRELSSHHGTTWLLAAPLTCHDNCALNLVGAVLAAGTGSRPSICPAWLREWSCEMAKSLAHASVQLMETSLDMLHVIFPPQVLQQLLYNAVQSDAQQQAALAEATARAAAVAVFAAGGGGPAQAAAPLSPPRPLQEDGSRGSGASRGRGYSPVLLGPGRLATGRVGSGSSQDAPHLDETQTSPFAALASASGSEDLGLSPTSPRSTLLPEGTTRSAELREGVQPVRLSTGSASSGGGGGHVSSAGPSGSGWVAGLAPLEQRSASMGSHCSLVRQASIASSAAAALLRQASLQSDTSFLFEDADSNPVGSPHGSEVAGFEDLLREDAARHAQRRISRDASPPPPPPTQHDSVGSMQWSASARSSPHSSPQSPMYASPTAAAALSMSRGPLVSLLSQQLPGATSPTSSPTSRGGLPLPSFRPTQLTAAAALQQAPPANMLAGAGGSSGGQASEGGAPQDLSLRALAAASGADAATATARLPEHRPQAQEAAGSGGRSGAGGASEWEEAGTPFASAPPPMAARAGANTAALGTPTSGSGAGLLEAAARGEAGEREPTFHTAGTRLEAIKEASSSSLASELSSGRLSAALSAALSLAGSPSGPGAERLARVAEEVAAANIRGASGAGTPTGVAAAGAVRAAAREGGSGAEDGGRGSSFTEAAGKEKEKGGSRAGDGAASGSSDSSFQDTAPAAGTSGAQPSDAEPAAPTKPAKQARPPSEPTDGQLAGASKPGAGGKLGAAAGSGVSQPGMPAQQWDLAFVDTSLETRYQRWSCRRLLAHDKLMGWTYAMVVAATLFALLCRRELTGELAALHAVGCVLFLLPGALACANVHFWSANRNDLLAVSRLASMAVYAAYAYVVVPHNVDGSSALLCALCRTGVCCMLICALRQLLPFSVHLPVQLLCLWMGTATIGLMNGRGLGPGCRALSLPVAFGAQVLLGFALPTALVWRHECRERRLFLNLHGRAAA